MWKSKILYLKWMSDEMGVNKRWNNGKKGPEDLRWSHNYWTDLGQTFRTFSPRLENNDTLKCSSDSFAHTLRYVVNVENCQNYIEMYHCPPIAGRRSQIALKLGGLRISECNIRNTFKETDPVKLVLFYKQLCPSKRCQWKWHYQQQRPGNTLAAATLPPSPPWPRPRTGRSPFSCPRSPSGSSWTRPIPTPRLAPHPRWCRLQTQLRAGGPRTFQTRPQGRAG